MNKQLGIKDIVAVTIAEIGLSINAVFIPWSQSRNKKEKSPSLNWNITLLHKGKSILTTDYSAGCAHCPSYKKLGMYNIKQWQYEQYIIPECQKGFPVTMPAYISTIGMIHYDKHHPIMPDKKDVIYSLVMDSDVINYDSFDEWASSFGYDTDSRTAEKIYNDCKEIAFRMVKAIGTDGLTKLQEAYQDY